MSCVIENSTVSKDMSVILRIALASNFLPKKIVRGLRIDFSLRILTVMETDGFTTVVVLTDGLE